MSLKSYDISRHVLGYLSNGKSRKFMMRLTRIRSTARQTRITRGDPQPGAAYHRPGRRGRDDRRPCFTSTYPSKGRLDPPLLCSVAPQPILSAYPAANGG